MAQAKTTFDNTVAEAVLKGLSASRKTLPSWLFYDHEGDRIFQEIMRMPEYYPTRCEYDILQKYKSDLLSLFKDDSMTFRLIEFGAGDGLKTEILLRHFIEHNTDFTYLPVDISAHVLELLSRRLTSRLPGLRINPQHMSYDEALGGLRDSHEKKVILFMGANIGNFSVHEAIRFLRKLALHSRQYDMLLIGFDLKKDPRIIQEAYDDPHGITAKFNLNLLKRLNRDVGADFQLQNFCHYPYYDPETGATRSFLISVTDQEVHVEALERSFHFRAWEAVQTEVSQKYDMAMIEKMMVLTGWTIEKKFCDPDNYFCDILVKR